MFIITSGRKCSYLFHLNKKAAYFMWCCRLIVVSTVFNDEYYSMQYFCVCERFVFICECFNHYNLLTVFWFWWWCFNWPILSFFFCMRVPIFMILRKDMYNNSITCKWFHSISTVWYHWQSHVWCKISHVNKIFKLNIACVCLKESLNFLWIYVNIGCALCKEKSVFIVTYAFKVITAGFIFND